MKVAILLAGLLGVFACSEAMDPEFQGSGDSNVRALKSGMSAQRVIQIIGAFQKESFDPSAGSYSCRSYLYDEIIAPKYVHVYFNDGKVEAASDGHDGFCMFGGDSL